MTASWDSSGPFVVSALNKKTGDCRMLKLYEAADRIEAQLLKDCLEEQGVTAVILGDALSGAMGELPVNIYPEVWVLHNQQMAQAGGILRKFISSRQAKGESKADWRCSNCGERVDAAFDICWNCASPRIREK